MPAAIYNTVVEEGRDFARTFTWKDNLGAPIDLTPYTSVRYAITTELDHNVVIVSVDSLNDSNHINFNIPRNSGKINLNISGSMIIYLPSLNGKYIHELVLVQNPGPVISLMTGEVVFRRAIA